jgi:hypothetical protein
MFVNDKFGLLFESLDKAGSYTLNEIKHFSLVEGFHLIWIVFLHRDSTHDYYTNESFLSALMANLTFLHPEVSDLW